MFNPGETVRHEFLIPFLKAELSKVIVSYKQDGDIVLEKTITSSDFIDEETKTRLSVLFSQKESLLFGDNKNFTIQINVYTKSGTRATSKEIKGSNGVQHHREVMTSG